jgi:hypothetical protein
MGELGSEMTTKQTAWALEKINNILAEKPHLALKVLFQLETGALEDPGVDTAAANEWLPVTSNKWGLQSKDLLQQMLKACKDGDYLEKLAPMGKATLCQALCYCLHVESTSAIYSKHKEELLGLVKQRYTEMGERLDKISISTGAPEEKAGLKWGDEFGYFSVQVDGEVQYLTAKQAAGKDQRCRLPDEMQRTTWELENAGNYAKASLRSGIYAIPCANVFKGAQVELVPPELLKSVPASSRTPGGLGSQKGSASSPEARTGSPAPNSRAVQSPPAVQAAEAAEGQAGAPPPPPGWGGVGGRR